jgi:hypothetical protein
VPESVTLDDLTKVYPNGTIALQGLDLHVDAGEFMVGQLSAAQDPSAADVAAESQGEIVAAAVASGVARVTPRAEIRPHAPALLAVDVGRLHFFDPATGMAIS